MIKAILYDLDGVLVDACEWHYESLNRALKEVADYSIPRSAHLIDFNGLTTKTKLAKLLDHRIITPEQVKPIWEAKQRYTVDIINEKAVPSEDKLQLHAFSKSIGVISACVTNSIRETATLMLEKTGQLPYMRLVIANEDAEPKPSPAPYLLAMEKLGLQPEECLIVEDSEKGLQSARASGGFVLQVEKYSDVKLSLIQQVVGGG